MSSMPIKPTMQTQAIRRPLGLLAAAALTVFAAGCSTISPPKYNPAVKSVEHAEEIALGAQIDAAVKRMGDQPHWATSLDDRAAFASFASEGVSVSYQGSAADLLKAIAAARGLSFKVTGPKPHIPIFVFVEAVDQPFEDFLRDLNKQFGQRADVVWADKAFELRYR